MPLFVVLLLQASWPTLHPLLLLLIGAVVSAGLTFVATRYWKVWDLEQAQKKAESQAITDLKQKQQSDILKMEGALALVVNTIDRLTGTAEQVTTITERVAGQGRRIDETRDDLAELRDTVQPQLADLKAAVQHFRDGK